MNWAALSCCETHGKGKTHTNLRLHISTTVLLAPPTLLSLLLLLLLLQTLTFRPWRAAEHCRDGLAAGRRPVQQQPIRTGHSKHPRLATVHTALLPHCGSTLARGLQAFEKTAVCDAGTTHGSHVCTHGRAGNRHFFQNPRTAVEVANEQQQQQQQQPVAQRLCLFEKIYSFPLSAVQCVQVCHLASHPATFAPHSMHTAGYGAVRASRACTCWHAAALHITLCNLHCIAHTLPAMQLHTAAIQLVDTSKEIVPCSAHCRPWSFTRALCELR
jgi:hypothetical protein